MNFLFPQFLWALTALSIPILIHFFNFRRYRTLRFSNTAFLQSAERNVRSFNRLRQLLILLLRCLALAAVVLAFARPYFPDESDPAPTEQNYYSLYIDNSLSMQLDGPTGPLLNEARQKAAELIKALPEQARVQVISNSFLSREQNFYAPREALELVDEIDFSPAFREGVEIRERIHSAWIQQAPTDSARLNLVLLSDFQKSAWKELQADWPDTWHINYLALSPANQSGNLAIDSVWFVQPVFVPGYELELVAEIKAEGLTEGRESEVKLTVNDQIIDLKTITIEPGQNQQVRFSYAPRQRGSYRAKVELDAAPPYFDNQLYFSFSVGRKVQVSYLAATDKDLIAKRFRDSLFEYQKPNLESLDFQELGKRNLLVIRADHPPSSGEVSVIENLLKGGQNIFLFPGEDPAYFENWISRLGIPGEASLQKDSLQVSKIVFEDPYFEGVFAEKPKKAALPYLQAYYRLTSRINPLLVLENGAPAIGYVSRFNGDIFLGLTNDQSGGLFEHPVILPVLINAALFDQEKEALYLKAGQAGNYLNFPHPQNADAAVQINAGEREIIPPQRRNQQNVQVFSPPVELRPGLYPVTLQDTLGYLALNPHPLESQLKAWQAPEIEKLPGAANLKWQPSESSLALAELFRNPDNSLYFWFILLALAMLLLEQLLIKIWRS